MKKIARGLILLIYAVGTVAYAADLTSSHYIVRDPTIGTGGGFQSSGSFRMYSAGNLNVSGDGGTSSSYAGRDGFLQYPVANAGVLTATAVGSDIDASWPATYVADGYHVSGYKIGIATTSGGPYTFTAVGNVLTYNYLNQNQGTYYLIVQTLDAFGNIIATSNEVSVTVQEALSFSLSANTVSFGSLTIAGPRYATSSGGASTVTAAHSLSAVSNSVNGYSVAYAGPTLTSGGNTIAPATIVGSASGTPGASQFAASYDSTGIATIQSSYDKGSNNWNFVPNTVSTFATTGGPTNTETMNAYYIANTSPSTPAGSYATSLTYTITVNY